MGGGGFRRTYLAVGLLRFDRFTGSTSVSPLPVEVVHHRPHGHAYTDTPGRVSGRRARNASSHCNAAILLR